MLEAQRRGHSSSTTSRRRWRSKADALRAPANDVSLRDESGNHFTLGERRRVDLGTYDVVLMRQDPPFDMNYITITHMLEHIHPKTLVVNDPRGSAQCAGKTLPPALSAI